MDNTIDVLCGPRQEAPRRPSDRQVRTTGKTERVILAMRAKGMGMGRIAKEAGVGCGTVQRVLKEAGAND